MVLLVVKYFVVKAEQVNRYRVFTRVVLLHSGEERLGEVESRDPEHARSTVLKPLLSHQILLLSK